MKDEDLYLPEDGDILGSLKDIGAASTGLALSDQKLKISELQIKASLRTRKTLVDHNRSNSKLTWTIIFFTVVQIIIGTFQFVAEVAFLPSKLFSAFITIALVFMVWNLSNIMYKKLEEDSKK